MDPRYRGILAKEISSVAVGGVTIKVIAGKVNSTVGSVKDIVTDPEYLDVTVPPHSEFTHRTVSGHTVFAYIIEGRGLFCKEKDPFSYEVEGVNYFDIKQDPFIGNATLVLFDDGEQVSVSTEKDPLRFLLVSGKPIGEPVAWYGPIVMNTREELQLAFEEFNSNTFIKHKM
jgi:redox-sensitive bicupin YhaK (pirin superfamily)